MTERISFGPFEFDPDRSVLLRDGVPVPIGQRAGAVLAALLAGRGRAVAKADLMTQAWPGVIVEEGNLSVQIAAFGSSDSIDASDSSAHAISAETRSSKVADTGHTEVEVEDERLHRTK